VTARRPLGVAATLRAMAPESKKVPAIAKAPLDYLFALVISLGAVGMSFLVDPPETKWIVFAVGLIMTVSVLAAAAKPTTR